MKKIIDCVESTLAGAWRRASLATEVSEEAASVLRILLGVFFLLFATDRFYWVGELPRSFFSPPYLSLANLSDGFPSVRWFWFYDLAAPLLILFVTMGVWARWAGLTLVALHLVISSFVYSSGKIDHFILLWMTLLCFSFSNWGTRFALLPDAKVRHHQTPITLLGICIAFGMFTAGYEKAVVWLDFDLRTNGFLSWCFPNYFSLERQALLASSTFYLPPLMLEAADYSAIVFELSGFLFLLLGRIGWRSWLVIACVFHALNTLLLNIVFPVHLCVYLPFLISPLVEKYFLPLSPMRRSRLCRAAFFLAGGLTAGLWAWRLATSGVDLLFMVENPLFETVQLYGALGLWFGLGLLGLLGIKILRDREKADRERV